MTKRIGIIAGFILIMMITTIPTFSQDCGFLIVTNEISVDRDGTALVSVPVYLSNNCSVGGIKIDFVTDPSDVINPIGIDATSGRISDWEYLIDTVSSEDPNRLRVVGIANWPGGIDVAPLDSGDGLLFNVLYEFSCSYETNTLVNVTLDSVAISDSSGYIVYDAAQISILDGHVNVGDDVTDAPRGDANCSGAVLGSDVTYLVSYFRGQQKCACCLCAGDANNSGDIIGSDVTFLVRYLSGLGPAPDPCEE
ncbi:MAG: hypothetical protein GY839_10570 [candidate division Zixibacteria bacterium]|nr:hypothetical protein [candidate division Zixibacteria bacterium]